MVNSVILTKAIEKARKNGWDLYGWKNFQVVMGGVGFYDGEDEFVDNDRKGNLDSDYQVIFSHDFAKAFFGEEEYERNEQYTEMGYLISSEKLPTWKHELQQMVLEEDPIKYLEKFI